MRSVRVAARASPLSKAQVAEIFSDLNLSYTPCWVETSGDLDKTSSLKTLEKTDFFTKEVDELVLKGICDISIHSAKDLPDPLPEGLKVIALTKGIDPSDSLVMRPNESLRSGMTIGLSSQRREETLKKMDPSFKFKDIRGTIEERLRLLDTKEVDGVVVAECAIIRLKLNHLNRLKLEGQTAPLQGRLAILAKSEIPEFNVLDARPKIIYTGLRSPSPLYYHYPTIGIEAVPFTPPKKAGHLLLTSQTALTFYKNYLDYNMKAICVGRRTAMAARKQGLDVIIATQENQEGVIELLKSIGVERLIWPRSTQARPLISNYCKEKGIDLIEIPVYRPVPKPLPVPLEDFDSIIFTSPSTIESIAKIPKPMKTYAIGPITEMALRNKFGSDLIILKEMLGDFLWL